MSKGSEKKLAHRRLQMLEFAETLGNVSEVCRKMGISRTQFYEYKRRRQEQGLAWMDGLRGMVRGHVHGN